MSLDGGGDFAALEKLLHKKAPAAPGERCDFCATPIEPEHGHLIDLKARRIMCGCRPCWLVFEPQGAALGRYKPIPRRYAEIELIRDLLPVVDNVGRAIAAAEKQADAALLLSGLKMMQQQLEEVFQKHHAKVITAAGEPFDPSRHEAVMQQPSGEHPEHTVLGVARQGLTLHDRVVRPAQVIVSARPAQ